MGCDSYHQDLSTLYRLLGNPPDFNLFLIDVPLNATDSFESIRSLRKGKECTAAAVMPMLRTGNLFRFGNPSIYRIGDGSCVSPNLQRIDEERATEADDRVEAYERGELPTIAAEDVYREHDSRKSEVASATSSACPA